MGVNNEGHLSGRRTCDKERGKNGGMTGKGNRTFLLSRLNTRPAYSLRPVSTKSNPKFTKVEENIMLLL